MSKKPILSFTVKLSKWRCGFSDGNVEDAKRDTTLGKGETSLLNDYGYKCCLGFACQQAGYKGKISDCGGPNDLAYAIPGLSYRDKTGTLDSTDFTDQAIQINDNRETTIEQKQKALISLGKRNNIKVNFIP